MKLDALFARLALQPAAALAVVLAVAFLLAAPSVVRAAAVPVAREGEAAPDGNGTYGTYTSFGEPCLNDVGQVAFSARLGGTAGGTADDEVITRALAGGPDTSIVREGEALPLGGAFASGLHFVTRQYVMNNAGRVAFPANLTGTPGGSTDNAGLYSSAGPGTLVQHARKGATAPGFASTFASFFPPQINNQAPANVSFFAGIGTTGPGAIYSATASTLTRLAYGGQLMPDGNGSIRQFYDSDPPALRPNADEVAVMALLWSNNGTLDDGGLLKGRAAGISIVARGGNPAPGGGTYDNPWGPVINILGNAAFVATRYPTSSGEGIYLAGGSVLGGARIASTGLPAPDHNGTFSGFQHPSLSAGNLVSFRADLTATAGGGFDDSGIYRGDSLILIQIAREDEVVPEGGGRFASFGNVTGINAAGQVLFTANLRGTPGGANDDRGLYLWDEAAGLCKVLREGDVIDGRTVLAFSTLTARDFGGFRCLNDAGEAVARVDLSGSGGDGIYILTCPATAAVATPAPVPPAAGRLDVGPNTGAGPYRIAYQLAGPAAAAPVALAVHDVTGRLVRALFTGAATPAGELLWDGTGDGGRPLPRGVYFLRLTTPDATMVRRIVRIGS
jgi:hypothetical protein